MKAKNCAILRTFINNHSVKGGTRWSTFHSEMSSVCLCVKSSTRQIQIKGAVVLTGAKKVFTLLYPTVLHDVKSQSASAAALVFCCLVTLVMSQHYRNTSHIKTKQFPWKQAITGDGPLSWKRTILWLNSNCSLTKVIYVKRRYIYKWKEKEKKIHVPVRMQQRFEQRANCQWCSKSPTFKSIPSRCQLLIPKICMFLCQTLACATIPNLLRCSSHLAISNAFLPDLCVFCSWPSEKH